MSGSLNLALNSSGEPTPLNINALGELIVTTGGGGGTTNVDVVGNTIGLATEATVATLATQATLANLDSKVTAVDTGAVVVSSSASCCRMMRNEEHPACSIRWTDGRISGIHLVRV